ncbi:MAG: helix-turn-helix domain-containing protein [Sphingomonadaceae bacterium]
MSKDYEIGSGNVFDDLGLADAEQLATKAGLIGAIMRTIQERGLTQVEAARIAKIPQPRLSNLLRGKIEGVTTEKLMKAVALLGGHVRIVVDEHPEPEAAGKVELEVA